MKVYVLSSSHNSAFATRLVGTTANVKVVSITDAGKTEAIAKTFKTRMALVDAILVLIDSSFENDLALSMELRTALLMHERREILLIPILLGEATLPRDFSGMIFLKCDPESEEDIKRMQKHIALILKHRASKNMRKNTHLVREKTSSMVFLSVVISLFTIFVSILLAEYPSKDMGIPNSFLEIVMMLSIPLTLSALMTSFYSIVRRRHNEEASDEIESYSRRLQSAFSIANKSRNEKSDSSNGDCDQQVDALGRMLINLEDIKEFYTWSQKQAKGAFRLAVGMCIMGFLLIGGAIVIQLFFKQSTDLSLLSAIGGVVTELIAGTALIVYKSSLAQLNHYHKALHEDERFLSSVNLIGKFSNDEIRDEMLREIIRSEIQMNLESLKDDTKINEAKKSQ